MYAKYKREWTPLEQWKPIDMQLPINTRYMTLTTLIVLWIFQYSSNGCNCPRIVYTWWHYRSLLLNTPCLPCPYRFFALIGYYWYSLSKQLWGPHDIGMSPVKGNPSWATFPIQMGHSSPSQDWILIMQLMYVLVYAMFILVCMVSCTCHVLHVWYHVHGDTTHSCHVHAHTPKGELSIILTMLCSNETHNAT